jgi:hypothetical protein
MSKEEKIKFNTQICTTIEQSKRLLEFGLDVQTSDCYHYAIQYFDGVSYENTGKMAIGLRSNIADENHFDYLLESFGLDDMDCFIPAWSLHRLIAMLPDFFSNLGRQFNLKMDKCFLRYCTARNDEYIYFQQKDTLYDNIIDCIEWLIKENKFNKEYLKEK